MEPAQSTNVSTPPEEGAPEIVGSRALRHAAYERFAQAIATLKPPVVAYREAGLGGQDYHADRGNAARMLRRRDVQNRVEFFSRQHEQIIGLKQRHLERLQWMVITANLADYYKTEEGRREPQLRPFCELTEDQQLMIESLKFTEKGKPVLQLYSKAQAHTNLCKMLNIGARSDDDDDREFSRLDDASLFAEIAREAKELGVDVEFTFRANGASA